MTHGPSPLLAPVLSASATITVAVTVAAGAAFPGWDTSWAARLRRSAVLSTTEICLLLAAFSILQAADGLTGTVLTPANLRWLKAALLLQIFGVIVLLALRLTSPNARPEPGLAMEAAGQWYWLLLSVLTAGFASTVLLHGDSDIWVDAAVFAALFVLVVGVDWLTSPHRSKPPPNPPDPRDQRRTGRF